MEKLRLIDRFGLKAVTGSDVLHYGELRRLMRAEEIVISYASRQKAQNWAAWMTTNPRMAEILAEAEKLAND